jgi:hypothetical protein
MTDDQRATILAVIDRFDLVGCGSGTSITETVERRTLCGRLGSLLTNSHIRVRISFLVKPVLQANDASHFTNTG